MKQWYNGYNFSSRAHSSLYNPLSIHSYFREKEAKGYWADKGHAAFLFDQIMKRGAFSRLNPKIGIRKKFG